MAELVGEGEPLPGIGLVDIDEDPPLRRDDHAAACDRRPDDLEAKQVLGDRLHRHRVLGAPEAVEVAVAELVRSRIGDGAGHTGIPTRSGAAEEELVNLPVAALTVVAAGVMNTPDAYTLR